MLYKNCGCSSECNWRIKQDATQDKIKISKAENVPSSSTLCEDLTCKMMSGKPSLGPPDPHDAARRPIEVSL